MLNRNLKHIIGSKPPYLDLSFSKQERVYLTEILFQYGWIRFNPLRDFHDEIRFNPLREIKNSIEIAGNVKGRMSFISLVKRLHRGINAKAIYDVGGGSGYASVCMELMGGFEDIYYVDNDTKYAVPYATKIKNRLDLNFHILSSDISNVKIQESSTLLALLPHNLKRGEEWFEDKIIEKYIEDDNTIGLAIVPCECERNMQEIINRLKQLKQRLEEHNSQGLVAKVWVYDKNPHTALFARKST